MTDLDEAGAIDDAEMIDPTAETPDHESIAIDRAPTKPMLPVKGARVEIDLEDADSAAAFLEMVARIIRERRRVTIVVE